MNRMQVSPEASFQSGRSLSALKTQNKKAITFALDQAAEYTALEKAGVFLDSQYIRDAAMTYGMDDAQGLTLSPTGAGVPVQFLQAMLPGVVKTVFGITVADELLGVSTVGRWEDEMVVQAVVEGARQAQLYRDNRNVPLVGFQATFNSRTIVQGEAGFSIGLLEEARTSAMKISASEVKRGQASTALEQFRNTLAFFGYNSGSNKTYGMLNDPGLPSYVNAPNGASASPLWSSKTFAEVVNDFINGFNALAANSKGNVDPKNSDITIGLPTGYDAILTRPTTIGDTTVIDWLKRNYPRARVITAPQFTAANGAANVMYMYAESVDDSSTDDNRTWIQPVPVRFMALGTHKTAKTVVEDFANATAGAMLKRPYAVYRLSGI